jgi:hypothetical protein
MTAQWAAVCIKLLQGALYENEETETWKLLQQYQREIAAYFEQIGISLFIEPVDGYAFLEQKETEEGDSKSVKLIRHYPLTFELSLLCVLLREALEQFDVSQNTSSMLVLKASEIRGMLSIYFKEKTDQTKLYKELNRYLNQAVDIGFLKNLNDKDLSKTGDTDTDPAYEVRRIVRAKVSVDFLAEFKERLQNF